MDCKMILIPLRQSGHACANCKAIFCQQCVEDGILATHKCEEGEEAFF